MYSYWVFTTKEKKWTTWSSRACGPQTFWRLGVDGVDLLPRHQPIREMCTSWSHTLWPTPPSPNLAFKYALLNPLLGFGVFWGINHPIFLTWPSQNLSLLQTHVSVCLASRCSGHTNLPSVTDCQHHALLTCICARITFNTFLALSVVLRCVKVESNAGVWLPLIFFFLTF